MKENNIDLTVLFSSTILALVGGSVFYRFIENWSWLDSAYFAIMTLTTVGYGDFVPSSPASKIFTMVYVFVGIGIIFGFIHAVAKRSLNKAAKRRIRFRKK